MGDRNWSQRGERAAANALGLGALAIIAVVFLLVIFFAAAFVITVLFIVAGIAALVFGPPKYGWILGLVLFALAALFFLSSQGQQLSLELTQSAMVAYPGWTSSATIARTVGAMGGTN